MSAWVEPLLYATAEAAATHDWALAARALDTFSCCVAHGAHLEVCGRLHSLVGGFADTACHPLHSAIIYGALSAHFAARRRRPECTACTRC